MKKILLACGTGVATSTVVNSRLDDAMKKRGLAGTYTAVQCKIAEVAAKSENFDIIISTTRPPPGLTKPFINGLPLLTGVGAEKVWDQVAELIKQ